MLQSLNLHRIGITIRGIRSEATKAASAATVYSVLYGKTDADFQRIIDQESTSKLENTTLLVRFLLNFSRSYHRINCLSR